MEVIKNVLMLSLVVAVVSVVLAKTAYIFLEKREKRHLSKILPDLIEKNDYSMVVIELNRSCSRGLSDSVKTQILWYTDMIMSMKVDYSREKYVNVIKNS